MCGRSPSVGPPRSRLRPALCCMAARCGLAWADGARRCSAGLRPFGGAARPPRRARCPPAAEAHHLPRPPKGHLMPFIETADRTSLFVTYWGSGPPVVFTHAWGLRSDQWNYQIPALTAAGLRCVLYDRRGHGRSGRPAALRSHRRLVVRRATAVGDRPATARINQSRATGSRHIADVHDAGAPPPWASESAAGTTGTLNPAVVARGISTPADTARHDEIRGPGPD